MLTVRLYFVLPKHFIGGVSEGSIKAWVKYLVEVSYYMWGLYGRKNYEIKIKKSKIPEVTGRMVLVYVHACGVCGTDIHILNDSEEYMELGHEIAAEVVAIGSDVTKVRVGDNVVLEDATMCGACLSCKSNEVFFCREPYTWNGQSGLANYLLVHENMLNIFTSMDYVKMSMCEPLVVAINTVNRAELPTYASLLIVGMGTIGLLCAAYAQYLGLEKVVMVGRDENSLRSATARKIADYYGVKATYYSENKDYVEKLIREQGSFDAAITAAPPTTVSDALKCVKYGGNVVAIGVTFGDNTGSYIDINDMIFNKKSILTMLSEPGINYPLAIRLIESGRIDVGKVITDRFQADEYNMLKEYFNKDSSVIKAVMVNESRK